MIRNALFFAGLTLILSCQAANAHGFGGPGWLHPLTGPDHMLAMVAVGAWSAQLGGRAIWAVPSAFVVAMATGGAVGLLGFNVPGTQTGIAVSVLLLGVVIAFAWRAAWPVACAGTLLFGFSHGVAHGAEIPATQNPVTYAIGFLATTAGLHVVGLAGASLLLERKQGNRILRASGACTAVAGVGFLFALSSPCSNSTANLERRYSLCLLKDVDLVQLLGPRGENANRAVTSTHPPPGGLGVPPSNAPMTPLRNSVNVRR